MDNDKKIVDYYNRFNQQDVLKEVFYENDLFVPYKDLKIYPVEVMMYRYFHVFVDGLLLSKNEGGIKVISMSYLEYILYLADEENNEQPIQNIVELFKMCLKLDDVLTIDGVIQRYKDETPRPTVEFCFRENTPFFRIMNKEYSSTDFNNIKQIICEQNGIDLPDPKLHPDVLKMYKDKQEYKRKQSKMKICSFGDQLCVVLRNTSYTKDKLLKMTIRTFNKLLERIDLQLHYEIMTMLSPNMDKKGQDSITHYLADTTVDIFKEATVELETIKNKLN